MAKIMTDHHCVVALKHAYDAVIACCAQQMRKYGISRLNFVYKKDELKPHIVSNVTGVGDAILSISINSNGGLSARVAGGHFDDLAYESNDAYVVDDVIVLYNKVMAEIASAQELRRISAP